MRKSEPLISFYMWRNILVQAVYQLIANLVILFAGASIFNVEAGSVVHYTMVFNTFVWMQLFNEVNSRKLENEKNAFAGIRRNPLFLAVMVTTIVVQVLFVEVFIPFLFSFLYFLFFCLFLPPKLLCRLEDASPLQLLCPSNNG